MSTNAFHDTHCPKCRAHIGWFGRSVDRPKCECGHSVDRATLEAESIELDKTIADLWKKVDERDTRVWKARTPELEAAYREGAEARAKHGELGPLDLMELNPYTPLKLGKTYEQCKGDVRMQAFSWGFRESGSRLNKEGA